MRAMIASLLLLLGAWSLVPSIDHSRHERQIDAALLFPPNGEHLRTIATGLEEPLADLLWVRTVLVFGERYEVDQNPAWVVWLRKMLLATTTLDPTWRTAYFYGGVMLRVSGDVEGSGEIFERASHNLPDDWFFPFSLGMNAYLYEHNLPKAAEWLNIAAALPGAPPWYAAAAAAMKAEAGGRKAAMKYLKGVLDNTTDPAIRESTQIQLDRLLHDDIVETWTAACRDYRASHQAPLGSVADLAQLGFQLPPNPRGDAWVVGRDGVVRSEGADAELWHDALLKEMALIGR
jgi:tetratricopeptide (TPR) repeat protein